MAYFCEIGDIDLTPKDDPEEEMRRLDDIKEKVEQYYLETTGKREVDEDEIYHFPEKTSTP